MVNKGTLATFRVESDLWEQFKARATESRYSASALLLQFVEDYVLGNVPNAIDGNTRIDNLDRRIDGLDERLDKLEKRLDTGNPAARIDGVDGHLDMGVARVECLDKNSESIDAGEASEPPIGTKQLCDLLGVNYTNLATRGKKHKRTPEEQLISEALEKGQHWRVCDRNGKALLWKRIG